MKTALPSPMRILRAWLGHERHATMSRAAVLDVIERQIDRESSAVRAAAAQAGGADAHIAAARQCIAAALHDRRTPGAIDAVEARAIVRHLAGASTDTHRGVRLLQELL